VAVVGIRKFKRAHKGLVSRDETVGDRGVHEAARSVENGGIEVWTRCKDAAETLIQNRVGSACSYKSGVRNANQQIAHWRQKQHTSVVDDGECHQ
jgi:hypothetical protein